VTVFERRGSVAAENSFANTGVVAPGLALPWAVPGAPRPGSGFGLRWRQWRAARDANLAERQDRLLRLAEYSHARLQELRRSLQLDFERDEGQLVLLRSPRDLAGIEAGLARLDRLGLSYSRLDVEQCRAVEPGLNPQTPLHGGLRLQPAEVGNCRQFAHLLRLEAQRLGVQFRFDTAVQGIATGQPVQLLLDTGSERFEALIVCAALESAALLRPLGLKLPLQGVPACSITAPLRQLEAHPDLGPRAGLLDLQRQVGISRIGQRVRVSGADEAALHQILHDWFPGAMQAGQVQRWSGNHALMPDGLPLLGGSGLPGIWLNTAHSDEGWTLACGAARALAETLAGLKPEVDLSGLDVTRLA